MRKPTKPGTCPRTTPLTAHELSRVTAGKEDAGIHLRPIAGDPPVKR